MDGSLSSSPDLSAPTPPVGGRASLRRLLQPHLNVKHRATIGGVLWLAAALIGAVQLVGPDGFAIPTLPYATLLGGATLLGLACLMIGGHTSERAFAPLEQFMLVLAWLMAFGMVAATGAGVSPDIVLYANVVFYCAYFLPDRRAVGQIAFGSILLWLPMAYDFGRSGDADFAVRAAAMTAVLWAMALLIARNRRALGEAEIRAKRLALTDALTGVANLRTFESEIERMLAGAGGDAGSFGVAFVDVNGLKAANTAFGHSGGDQLIKRTADILLACASTDDQVARVGGDEFAVLLANADREAVKQFESRFAATITERNSTMHKPAPQLSASIGTAVHPVDGSDFDSLMRVADARMYDSKSALPRELPLVETSGGRKLTRQGHVYERRRRRRPPVSSGPGAGLVWMLGASIILLAQIPSLSTDQLDVSALLLAALCMLMAAAVLVMPLRHRDAFERTSNTIAVAAILPVLYITGGAASAALPLAYLIVAHASYALAPKAAIVRTAVVIALLPMTLLFGWSGYSEAPGLAMVAGEVLLIAWMLQSNRRRIEHARATAEALSQTDPLTGLANRRVFEAELARRGADLQSGDVPAGGLILIDIDDFKQINTASGHLGGDEVLRTLSAVLEGTIAKRGRVCRIGGDEFAVIVHQGNERDVARTAATSRAVVQSVDWSALAAPGLTVSVGYATWNWIDDWTELVAAADLALQISKDSGKNKITAAPAQVVSQDAQAAAVAVAPPRAIS